MLTTADPLSLSRAREVLLQGGVICFPTETVYGLGVLYGNPEAEQRLRRLKGRDAAKPFQLLVADAAAAENLARVTPVARAVLREFWPGALTVVLPARQTPPPTVGLRAPDSPWLQELLRSLPTGITATSANLSGEPPACDAAAAQSAIGDRVDLLIDGDTCAIGTASTVISLVDDELKIFRQGAVTAEDLSRIIAAARRDGE